MNIFLFHAKEWEGNGELEGETLGAYSTKEAAMSALIKDVRMFNSDVFNDPKSNYFAMNAKEFEDEANREFKHVDEAEDGLDDGLYNFYFGWRSGDNIYDYEISELIMHCPSE